MYVLSEQQKRRPGYLRTNTSSIPAHGRKKTFLSHVHLVKRQCANGLSVYHHNPIVTERSALSIIATWSAGKSGPEYILTVVQPTKTRHAAKASSTSTNLFLLLNTMSFLILSRTENHPSSRKMHAFPVILKRAGCRFLVDQRDTG